MSNFSENLKILMRDDNLSSASLHKLTGISKTQLGKYLSNHYEPSLKNAIKISNYFNCSLDYLLGLDEERNGYEKLIEPSFDKFIIRYKELLILNNTNHKRISTAENFNRNLLVYWNKHKTLPSLDILNKIAKHLKTSVDYLIGRIDYY